MKTQVNDDDFSTNEWEDNSEIRNREFAQRKQILSKENNFYGNIKNNLQSNIKNVDINIQKNVNNRSEINNENDFENDYDCFVDNNDPETFFEDDLYVDNNQDNELCNNKSENFDTNETNSNLKQRKTVENDINAHCEDDDILSSVNVDELINEYIFDLENNKYKTNYYDNKSSNIANKTYKNTSQCEQVSESNFIQRKSNSCDSTQKFDKSQLSNNKFDKTAVKQNETCSNFAETVNSTARNAVEQFKYTEKPVVHRFQNYAELYCKNYEKNSAPLIAFPDKPLDERTNIVNIPKIDKKNIRGNLDGSIPQNIVKLDQNISKKTNIVNDSEQTIKSYTLIKSDILIDNDNHNKFNFRKVIGSKPQSYKETLAESISSQTDNSLSMNCIPKRSQNLTLQKSETPKRRESYDYNFLQKYLELNQNNRNENLAFSMEDKKRDIEKNESFNTNLRNCQDSRKFLANSREIRNTPDNFEKDKDCKSSTFKYPQRSTQPFSQNCYENIVISEQMNEAYTKKDKIPNSLKKTTIICNNLTDYQIIGKVERVSKNKNVPLHDNTSNTPDNLAMSKDYKTIFKYPQKSTQPFSQNCSQNTTSQQINETYTKKDNIQIQNPVNLNDTIRICDNLTDIQVIEKVERDYSQNKNVSLQDATKKKLRPYFLMNTNLDKTDFSNRSFYEDFSQNYTQTNDTITQNAKPTKVVSKDELQEILENVSQKQRSHIENYNKQFTNEVEYENIDDNNNSPHFEQCEDDVKYIDNDFREDDTFGLNLVEEKGIRDEYNGRNKAYIDADLLADVMPEEDLEKLNNSFQPMEYVNTNYSFVESDDDSNPENENLFLANQRNCALPHSSQNMCHCQNYSTQNICNPHNESNNLFNGTYQIFNNYNSVNCMSGLQSNKQYLFPSQQNQMQYNYMPPNNGSQKSYKRSISSQEIPYLDNYVKYDSQNYNIRREPNFLDCSINGTTNLDPNQTFGHYSQNYDPEANKHFMQNMFKSQQYSHPHEYNSTRSGILNSSLSRSSQDGSSSSKKQKMLSTREVLQLFAYNKRKVMSLREKPKFSRPPVLKNANRYVTSTQTTSELGRKFRVKFEETSKFKVFHGDLRDFCPDSNEDGNTSYKVGL